MHNAHLVKVVDGIQHLSDQRAGILLCVEALLHDSVKQLAARHSVYQRDECISLCAPAMIGFIGQCTLQNRIYRLLVE